MGCVQGFIGGEMVGTYDLTLVALSVGVAIVASYAALDLAGRVSAKEGRKSFFWLLGGALAMGTGIWAMHFIGMLAFVLPLPIAYDNAINATSWLVAIGVSGVALLVVRQPSLTARNISAGAALMGIGIASMHYIGMAAMRMSPPIVYDPLLFIASVIIAIAASLAALWIAFYLRKKRSSTAILAKLGSAGIMGFAIAGMHYTGMAAAHFAPDSVCLAAGASAGLETGNLAGIIALATFGILSITLIISAYDGHSARLSHSLQLANEQLRNMALHDNLTGLPNRILLEDRLRQVSNRADRNKRRFAVLFVDLDKFKPVNDRYGHRIGDEVLKSVAQRLTASVRKDDTVARAGGDEFVIVLSEIVKPEDAAMISRKIIDELSRPFFIEDKEFPLACSIGISVYPDDGTDRSAIVVNADLAMYHAKQGGRSDYRFYIPEMCVAARGTQ
jgi:diguanylate cyclase (GGDEF)-like protein